MIFISADYVDLKAFYIYSDLMKIFLFSEQTKTEVKKNKNK